MNIDAAKNAEGNYVAANGCEYDGPVEFILEGMFGFCGCGRPFQALMYIRSVLTRIDALRSHKNEPWGEFYANWKADNLPVFSNEGAEFFAYYIMDKAGLTEHGGSVPGWLSESGVKLLSDLNELALREDERSP